MRKELKHIAAAIAIGSMLCLGCEENNAPTRPDPIVVPPDTNKPQRESYNIYFGNVHSHSTYSGDVTDTSDTVENLFSSAKESGYDFYAVTDHSQYATYSQEAWENIKTQADKISDSAFRGIRGYEHSENNGPDAKGHLNVYNTPTYLNALADGISMQYFHDWLSLPANSNAVVTMNHPEKNQYDTFHCYNSGARDIIRLIELINGTKDYHESFLVALSKGWRVAPVAGNDNHNLAGVTKWVPRTGIAAKSLRYDDLIEAMHSRRTFATFNGNLSVMYYVNNYDMGSEINPEGETLAFHIEVSDPDTGVEADKIVRIEIMGENDKVVDSKECSGYSIVWDVDVPKQFGCYYLKIYNASKQTPVAYAAPVWIKQN